MLGNGGAIKSVHELHEGKSILEVSLDVLDGVSVLSQVAVDPLGESLQECGISKDR